MMLLSVSVTPLTYFTVCVIGLEIVLYWWLKIAEPGIPPQILASVEKAN